jgi:uncharacterized protein (DUF2147 family)
MRSLAFLFGCAVVVTSVPVLAAEPPIGEWLEKDGYAQVKVENCSGALWGVISWEARPGGRDNENPDPALRGRPVLGMPILLDMKEQTYSPFFGPKEQRWVGHVYNSENGKMYDANVKLQSPNVMRMAGCLIGVCLDRDWTRVAGTAAAPQSKGPAPKGKGAPSAGIDVCSRITR